MTKKWTVTELNEYFDKHAFLSDPYDEEKITAIFKEDFGDDFVVEFCDRQPIRKDAGYPIVSAYSIDFPIRVVEYFYKYFGCDIIRETFRINYKEDHEKHEEIGDKVPENGPSLWVTALKANVVFWIGDNKRISIPRRPKEFQFNDQEQLHNEEGPALVMMDPLSIPANPEEGEMKLIAHFFLQGIEVDKKWIMDKTYTGIDILKDENAEVKRVVGEMYGWGKLLTEVKANVIDAGHDTNDCMYAIMGIPGEEFNIICLADGSTNRCYTLPVPSSCGTYEESMEYLQDGEKYKLVAQT